MNRTFVGSHILEKMCSEPRSDLSVFECLCVCVVVQVLNAVMMKL